MELQHTKACAKCSNSTGVCYAVAIHFTWDLFCLFIYFCIYSLVPASKWNWLFSLPELAGHLKERHRTEQSSDEMRLMVESCLTMIVIRLADQSRADLGLLRPHSDLHRCPFIFISFPGLRAPRLFSFCHLQHSLNCTSCLMAFLCCNW